MHVYFEVMICQNCHIPLVSVVRKITDPCRGLCLLSTHAATHSLSVTFTLTRRRTLRTCTPVGRRDEIQILMMARHSTVRLLVEFKSVPAASRGRYRVVRPRRTALRGAKSGGSAPGVVQRFAWGKRNYTCEWYTPSC